VDHGNTMSRTRNYTPVEKPFEDGGLAGISYETSKKEVTARRSGAGQKRDDRKNTTDTAETVGVGRKGVRGLMVRGWDCQIRTSY
jgi:hypothetical protein